MVVQSRVLALCGHQEMDENLNSSGEKEVKKPKNLLLKSRPWQRRMDNPSFLPPSHLHLPLTYKPAQHGCSFRNHVLGHLRNEESSVTSWATELPWKPDRKWHHFNGDILYKLQVIQKKIKIKKRRFEMNLFKNRWYISHSVLKS